MPAKSKAQQQLMGIALALKQGKMPKSKVSKQAQKLAASMSTKELEKFAKTKHKGLPEKLKEIATESDMESMSTDSLLGMQKIISLTDNPSQYNELNTLLGIELSKRGVNLRKKMGYTPGVKQHGTTFLPRESKGNNMKLSRIASKIVKENKDLEQEVQITNEQKQAFFESMKSYGKYSESIYRSQNILEAIKEIRNIVEVASQLTLQETGDWFDKVTVGRHMKQLKESYKTFEKTANEMYTLQQRLEACYEDIGNTLGKYYDIQGNAPLQEKEKANKDYDKDGNVESPDKEWADSRDKAIKKAMKSEQ